MAKLLCLAAVLITLAAALPATADTDANRLWSTIPDGPYTYAPPAAQSFVTSDGESIGYAVFMPNVPSGTRVPVILSAGPYFGLTEEPVNVPSSRRLTGFLVDNYVSHGYAVVAANVRGTGLSGGCMEMMSVREARDLDELVTFLANEPWSTGAVGMTGKSYDGGTPWMVAQFGNPALKTIVPMQGVSDMGDLMFHRGAPEFRGPLMHSALYYPFGFGLEGLGGDFGNDPGYRPIEARAANAACPELARGQAAAAYSTYTGDIRNVPGITDYWYERAFREPTIANYHGSVFIVHGLQDWNVIPSQVIPIFNELPVEKKLLMGQWAHQYPDEGANTNRPDFAAILKVWFDSELKGFPVNTGPIVEVADAQTRTWRSLNQWPPEPTSTKVWSLGPSRTLVQGPADPGVIPFVSPGGLTVHSRPCNQGTSATYFSTTLTSGFRLSGVGAIDVRLDPPTPGVLVVSVCAGNTLIAHGAAHTLYPKDNTLVPFVPGEARVITVDLEPAERTIASGTRLSVAVRFEDFAGGGESQQGYWPLTSPGIGVLTGGQVRLPVG